MMGGGDELRQVQLSDNLLILPIPFGHSHGTIGTGINARFDRLRLFSHIGGFSEL